MNAFQHLFEIAPNAKLTPTRGLRTTVAFLLALLVLAALGHSAFGDAVGLGFLLGALFTSFCDVGSAVRVKMVAMSALAITGPFVVAMGRSWPTLWWLDALAVFVGTLVAGWLAVYGPLASLVGLLLTIVFVLTLGIGGGPATALPSALGFLLGGAVVLLLLLASALLDRLWHRTARPEAPARAPPAPAAPSLSLVMLLRALGAGVAAAIAWNLGSPYPQWAPVVVIACVRPQKETSVLAALQNISGTVVGVLLADLFITSNSAQNPLVVVVTLLVVVFIAFTVKDLNYALFTFFMTNLTLLLISLSTPGVSHARLRIYSVLVGAGIALVVTFLSDWFAQRHPTQARA